MVTACCQYVLSMHATAQKLHDTRLLLEFPSSTKFCSFRIAHFNQAYCNYNDGPGALGYAPVGLRQIGILNATPVHVVPTY
jgi:hypothetical protein